MAYRRRRKSTGTWFPTFGIEVGEEGEETSQLVAGIQNTGTDIQPDGSATTVIHGVTIDFPRGEGDINANQADSLSDIIGSEYLLRRIVGKFFARVFPPSAEPFSFRRDFYVAAGFFVARADADNNNPIGSPVMSGVELFKEYSPAAQQTMREPWIWRRTWILSPQADNAVATGYNRRPSFPASTAGYGSVLDGPHIDSKSKRRIGQDDRLYFAVTTAAWPLGNSNDSDAAFNLDYFLDYRIFGSLRKAKQRSAF